MTTRKRPAPTDRPSRNKTTASEFTALRRPEDGYAAPTLEERREQQLLAELVERGYGITMPCLVCGHPLTAATSLARHIGPRCAAKQAVAK